MLTLCEHLMREVCTGVGAALHEFNSEIDDVHLRVHYPPSLALSVPINRLKGGRLAGYANNTRCTLENGCGASTSGHRPTSPPPAAAHH